MHLWAPYIPLVLGYVLFLGLSPSVHSYLYFIISIHTVSVGIIIFGVELVNEILVEIVTCREVSLDVGICRSIKRLVYSLRSRLLIMTYRDNKQ